MTSLRARCSTFLVKSAVRGLDLATAAISRASAFNSLASSFSMIRILQERMISSAVWRMPANSR